MWACAILTGHRLTAVGPRPESTAPGRRLSRLGAGLAWKRTGGLTVRWGNMRGSGNIEDREAAGPAGGLGGGFKLGGVGLIAVLAISWFLGLNPSMF